MENEAGERYLKSDELSKYRIPFDGKCWWCGSDNLTGEHKFKQTDLRAMFGQDQDNELIFFTDDGEASYVRGPNSAIVKFDKNLCADCNNARSQPFDRAWEDMSAFIRANWRKLKAGDEIRLSEVYPNPQQRGVAELTRYVVKHFGCKIAASSFPVPEDLPRYMDDPDAVTSIQIAMFYSDGRAQMMRAVQQDMPNPTAMLTNGGLASNIRKSSGAPLDYITELSVGPIGFLIKWSDYQPADRPLHRAQFAPLYRRSEMPYPELHIAVPDVGAAQKLMRDNPPKKSRGDKPDPRIK